MTRRARSNTTARSPLVIVATCLIVSAAPCWPASQVQTQKQYTIDLSRQPLMPAIRAFSTQTGLHVGFFPESPADENILVGPVHGMFTADAALLQLLHPNGLAYEWINERSIHIVKQRPRGSTTATASDEQMASTSGSKSRERRWPGDRERLHDIDFVIVIGTRLSSLETESQSVAVLNRQKIESYGVSTLAELFEYLPQIPFMRSEDFRAGGEQFADLRGLGPGTTLILINGRRVAGSATSFDTGGFDVNTIPLTAVQRIEVLLDSPSVAIGADSIGGVINVVLKDQISQPTMELRYGAADGGAEERRLSFGIGTSGEAFRGAATFDAFQRDHLLGAERDLSRDQDYRRFGGSDLRSLDASPGNIFSLTSANLPGLDSSFAAVPIGSSGIDLTPEAFSSTAGQMNRTSLGRFRSVVPEVSQLSLVASGELRLSRSIAAFAELLGTSRRTEFQIAPPILSGAVVPASNAFNPFGEPVGVNTALQGARAQMAITDADRIRAVTGFRGTWNQWEGEFSAAWNREYATVWHENELDATRVAQALASPDSGVALNPFRDGPAGSPGLLASLVAAPRVKNHLSESTQGYTRVQGPLVPLPAGEMTLMIGGEWRQERLSNPSLPTPPHRTISAAFAEVRAPLVRTDMSVPAVQELSVSVGVRSDDYTMLGAHLTPQYGLIWRPLADIKFRASYSEGYRIPSMYELYAPRISVPITISDPKRQSEVVSFRATVGGNTDLAPSSGYLWTMGAQFTPRAIPSLHLSAAYWRTMINNRIGLVAVPVLLSHEASFPGRVVRAERTLQDIEAGIPGTLENADISPGNFGRLRASGVDVNVSFTWDTSIGRFTPNLSATWNDTFSTALAAGMPPEERLGIASEFGTIPQWRAIASVGWTRGPLTLFSAVQFASAYDDAILGERTGRTIPSQTLIDAQASLQLDALVSSTSALSSVKVTAGVMNLLDRGPHFAEIGFDQGYDPSQGNLKQRFWYVRLAKEF